MRKKLRFIMLLMGMGSCFSIVAQPNIGYMSSNYSGVHGINLNPASMADNRLMFDVNILSLHTGLWNNYLSLPRSQALSGRFDWEEVRESFVENTSGGLKYATLSNNIQLPSLMLSIGNKFGIGVTSRLRNYVQLDGMTNISARAGFQNERYSPDYDVSYNNDGIRMDAVSFLELGVGFGWVIHESKKHMIKVGGRLKYLDGIAGASIYANSLNYTFQNDSTMDFTDVDAEYAHSIAFEFPDLRSIDFGSLANNDRIGWGLDLGLVYEFRPDHAGYTTGQGADLRSRRDKDKYKLRLGVSLIDMGTVAFRQSVFSQDFEGSAYGISLTGTNFENVVKWDSLIAADFVLDSGVTNFNMGMPTVLSFQADIQISEGLYLNITPYLQFNRGKDRRMIRAHSVFAITPRYERKWVGFAVPFMIDESKQVHLGVNLRLGPVIVGSQTIGSLLISRNVSGADAFVGLKVPIPHSNP